MLQYRYYYPNPNPKTHTHTHTHTHKINVKNKRKIYSKKLTVLGEMAHAYNLTPRGVSNRGSS